MKNFYITRNSVKNRTYSIFRNQFFSNFLIAILLLVGSFTSHAQCTSQYFSDALNLSPTEAANTWYTDRYTPDGFAAQSTSVGPNSRTNTLKHSISTAQSAALRPGGFSGSFYNTQGRKYNTPIGANVIQIDLYVPADWATSGRRMAGFWGTAYNASDVFTNESYPIIEFTSEGTPRFRGFESGDGTYIDLALPSGFAYDTWVTLKIELLPTKQYKYSIKTSAGSASVTTTTHYDGADPAKITSYIGNAILQGYNYNTMLPYTDPANTGVSYDIYWDNFIATLSNGFVKNVNTEEIFCTIQAAIDDSDTADGHVITVAAGTYNEQVSVNKQLTIKGANFGIAGNGVRGAESIVDGNNGTRFGFAITVPNVTIDGFKVQNCGGILYESGIYTNSTLSTIKNNVLYNNEKGVYPQNIGASTIENNLFDSNNRTGPAGSVAIYSFASNGLSILNNEFKGQTENSVILFDGDASLSKHVNLKFKNNYLHDNFQGASAIYALHLNNAEFAQNLITNGNRGIKIAGLGQTVNIHNNKISGTGEADITISNDGLGANTGVEIHENSLTGDLSINNLDVANVNGTCNWFGGIASVAASKVVGNVTYELFLTTGGDSDAGNGFTPTGTCTGCSSGNVVTNTTTMKVFCTIQAAIDDALTLNGHTITASSGTYNEQLIVNKEVILQGVGVTKPIINYTGTPATSRLTVIDVVKPNVTIDNFEINVDISKLGSAILASNAGGVNNLVVKNNNINPYRSSAATVGFSARNAININYGNTYRIDSNSPIGMSILANNISYNVGADMVAGGTDDAGFRSGVAMDEGTGTIDGNTIQSINQDVEVRFTNTTNDVVITHNNINGGGINIAEPNSAVGSYKINDNTFNGSFGSTYTSSLRLKNNNGGGGPKPTEVKNNTFTGHNWGIAFENFNGVTVDNNIFTPMASSTTYRHITVNTKELSSSSAIILQAAVGGIFTNNTFNGSGTTGGKGIVFLNHDSDNDSYGTFTLGTAGNENNFAAGIAKFIELDPNVGASTTFLDNATFPVTTMAPWAENLNAVNNKFDVGSGLALPATMNLGDLFTLEDKINHGIDVSGLGFVTVKANNDYVTTNSFWSPFSTTPSIQRGIDVASAGFKENVQAGNYGKQIAPNSKIFEAGATYQFGLHVNKKDISIVGYKADNTAVANASEAAVIFTTGATNSFGPSGVFVDADGVKIEGLKIGDNLNGSNVITNNKAIEIVADGFNFNRNWMNPSANEGSFYFGEYDPAHPISSYSITENKLENTLVSLNSGAGATGPVAGRVIKDNEFTGLRSAFLIGFRGWDGAGPVQDWITKPVGGAIITGNNFASTGLNDIVNARGNATGYDNTQLNWKQIWENNTYGNHVVTLDDLPTFAVHSFDNGTYPNTRRISPKIQENVNIGVNTNTVLIANGTYPEDVTLNKSLTLDGESRDGTIIKGLYTIGGNATLNIGTTAASNSIVKDLTISRDYQDWYGSAKSYGVILSGGVSNVKIDNVKVEDNRNGIYVENNAELILTNSLIQKNRTGLHLSNMVRGSVTNNIIRENQTHGVFYNLDDGPSDLSGFQMHDNSITGNWYSEILFRGANSLAEKANFECNWFGTDSPTVNATNTSELGYEVLTPQQKGGTNPGVFNGQIRGNGAVFVDYIPWRTGETGNNSMPFVPVGMCNGAPAPVTAANGTRTIECLVDAGLTFKVPPATDPCSPTPLIGMLESTVDSPPSIDCEGTRVYTYKYTSVCGQVAFWTYTYTIKHTTNPKEIGGPVANASMVQCAADAVAPTILPVVNDVCGNALTASAAIISNLFVNDFSSAILTSATEAAGVWYTDRFAPNAFASAVTFGGDTRLEVKISAADGSTGRGGLSDPFYNTQGRAFNVGPNADYIETKLYIPADWATSNKRMAGMWGVALGNADAVSAYPILEFTSDGGNPRFRGFETGAPVSTWIDLGLPTGFAYDTWVTLKTTLLPSGEFLYSVGDKSKQTSTSNMDGSVRFKSVILQGHNFNPAQPIDPTNTGVSYDIYWDDLKWNNKTYVAPTCEGIKNYRYDFKDCAGLVYSWNYTYTIKDTQAPTLTGTPFAQGMPTINSCKPTQMAAEATFVEADAKMGYTDNCNPLITVTKISTTFGSGDTDCSWTITHTYTLTDQCGNTSGNLTYQLKGGDKTAPSITLPAVFVNTMPPIVIVNDNVNVSTPSSSCVIVLPFNKPTNADNCTGTVVGSASAKDKFGNNIFIVDQGTTYLGNFPLGQNVITFTATDACGNSTTKVITVTVVDDVKPNKPTLPNIVVCGAVTPPTTTDNCTPNIIGTTTDPTSYFVAGVYTINWVFTDASGNSVSASQQVTVNGSGAISGSIVSDLTPGDNTVNGAAQPTATGFVSIINGTTILATVPVAGGVYTLPSVCNGTYKIVLHTTMAGSTTPQLPTGYSAFVSEGILGGAADATPNGIASVTVSAGAVVYNNARVAANGDLSFGLNPSSALPVRLVSFTGKSTEKGNELTWKASSEANFSHYEVERSVDASSFKMIGKVEGAGNTTENLSYTYLDDLSQNQTTSMVSGANSQLTSHNSQLSYYRLKMIDLDGSSAYSKVIFIENENEKSVVGEFYPNPAFGSEVSITITSGKSNLWTITSYDLSGRILNTETRQLDKGDNKLKFDTKVKRAGVSIFRFENADGIQFRKLNQ